MPARKHKLVPVINKHGRVGAVMAVGEKKTKTMGNGLKLAGNGRKKHSVRGSGYVSLGALPSFGW